MLLFVENLCVIDFSWLHAERGLLGDSLQLGVSLEGEPDEQGMLLDFAEVKRRIKKLADAEFDHRLLVPARYQGSTLCGDSLEFRMLDGRFIRHTAPLQAIKLIDAEAVQPQAIAAQMEAELQPLLPDNISRIQIRLEQEHIRGASYQYSHGLKLHCGNCQRIAHGHRSRIQILRNDKRDADLEVRWASQLKDSYIANREDVREALQVDGVDYLRFCYESGQGNFDLCLPASQCTLIDRESTVENIASHISQQICAEFPQDRIEVWAYEGIGKGAIIN